MTRAGIRRTAVGLFVLLTLWLAGTRVAAAAKLPQTLHAVDTFVVHADQASFPLLALEASSDAGDGARLTYSVVSGGDVIRVEGDRVDVIGWGDAQINIRADETADHQAAERLVAVRVVKSPSISVAVEDVQDGQARVDVSVEGGSYTAADLYGWSFGYRRAGTAEAVPAPIDWPGYLDFYFLLSRLEAPAAYEVIVSARFTDLVTGEEGRVEGSVSLRTGDIQGATLSGRVVDELASGEPVIVSLWSDGAVLATDAPLSEWGAFFLEGVPDGWYYLAAQVGQRTRTIPVRMEEGQSQEPLLIQVGTTSTLVEADAGVPAVCVSDLETALQGEEQGGEQYRLTLRRRLHEELSGADQALFQSGAGGGGTIGMYLDIGLERTTVLPDGGRQVEPVRQISAPLRFVITLPDHLLSKADYRVLEGGDGSITVLEADWDEAAGTLAFETGRMSTFAVLYSDSGPLPATIGGEPKATPEMENEAVPVMAILDELPTERDIGRIVLALAIALAGVLVAATAIVIILRKWRTPQPAAVFEQPQLPPELFQETTPVELPPLEPQEPSISDEELKELAEQELRMRLYPNGIDPAKEAQFFRAIEERKKLMRLHESGKLSTEQFRERVREVLRRM